MKKTYTSIVASLLLFSNAIAADASKTETRKFTSEAIDQIVAEMQTVLRNDTLSWMFTQCFPNTLNTAVDYCVGEDGLDDTFVITGDIDAMWLRDSGAQVWPYVAYINKDEKLRHLIRGVINRQLKCLNIDPYANAFYRTPGKSEWTSDYTAMTPMLHERKWELDSPCYVLRLIYGYWQQTHDAELISSDLFLDALEKVLAVFVEQQKWDGVQKTSYRFGRKTHAMHDTTSNYGYGHPVKPCGMIASMFRPSDDCTLFQFLIPSNFMAQDVLTKTARMMREVSAGKGTDARMETLIRQCEKIASEVQSGLQQHAIVAHPKYGNVYAFEVDGFGSALLQDDANVPSLLSLPYLTDMPVDDPIYQNTRRMILSDDNPYYFSGKAGAGIGSQHTTLDTIWPMSIIMQAMTSTDEAETQRCVRMLMSTHGGTGFMHESFHKDDDKNFTRSWFAWANTLFGELLIKLYR